MSPAKHSDTWGSLCPSSVRPSVTLPELCFAGDTCIPRNAATIFYAQICLVVDSCQVKLKSMQRRSLTFLSKSEASVAVFVNELFKNANFIVDVKCLPDKIICSKKFTANQWHERGCNILPVQFCQNLFSGCRREIELKKVFIKSEPVGHITAQNMVEDFMYLLSINLGQNMYSGCSTSHCPKAPKLEEDQLLL